MEIQTWEGAARRCVEAVLRSATATGMRVNEGSSEEMWRSDELERREEELCLGGKTEECGARRGTGSVGVGEDDFMPQR